MSGWIKLHRELFDKPIWINSTPEQKAVLITLLSMASHGHREWEFKGEKYVIQPGQFITSLESIAAKTGKGVSIRNIRTSLKRFENLDFLTNISTNRNRLITIVNWGIYQDLNNETDKQTDKQLTSTRQASDNYQECKEIKEGKEINNNNYAQEIFSESQWCETVCMRHNLTIESLREKISEFKIHLIAMEEEKKSMKDFKQHFTYWMGKQPVIQHPASLSNGTNQLQPKYDD